jgi:hypothetical protein
MDATADEVKITSNNRSILPQALLNMGISRNTAILAVIAIAIGLTLYMNRVTIRSYIETAMRLSGVTKSVDEPLEPSMASDRRDVADYRRAGATDPRGVVRGKRSTRDSSPAALNTALIQPDAVPSRGEATPDDSDDTRDDFTHISRLKRTPQ